MFNKIKKALGIMDPECSKLIAYPAVVTKGVDGTYLHDTAVLISNQSVRKAAEDIKTMMPTQPYFGELYPSEGMDKRPIDNDNICLRISGYRVTPITKTMAIMTITFTLTGPKQDELEVLLSHQEVTIRPRVLMRDTSPDTQVVHRLLGFDVIPSTGDRV